MSKLFWGSVLVVIGTLFLLQSAGAFQAGLSFWPVALLILGLYVFLRGLVPGRFSVRRRPSWIRAALGIWIASIGLFETLYDNGLSSIDGRAAMGIIWPILLVGLGLSLLVGAVFGQSSSRGSTVRGISWARGNSQAMKHWSKWTWWLGPDHHSQPGHAGWIGDVHFGREPWKLDGPLDLRYKVGDIRIDLTTADIAPGEHDIAITSSIGEIYVLVPAECSIRAEASVAIGSVSIFDDERSGVSIGLVKSAPAQESVATLNISVHLRIGTVTVRRVPHREEEEARTD